MTTAAADAEALRRPLVSVDLRAAGRRRAWRLHLGRARSPARGAVAADRRHLRHLGRRDERRRAGRRLRRRRRRRARGGARRRSGSSVSERGPAQPVPAQPAGRAARPLDARPFADVRRHGPDVAPVLALRPQSGAAPTRCADILAEMHRFRAAGAGADQAVRHRHQRPHRPRPGIPQRRDHARRAARLGLPADDVPGGRDRRRDLLGRRLFRQSDHHAAGARMRLDDTILVQINPVERPGTPRTRARHPQSAQRGLLQRRRC